MARTMEELKLFLEDWAQEQAKKEFVCGPYKFTIRDFGIKIGSYELETFFEMVQVTAISKEGNKIRFVINGGLSCLIYFPDQSDETLTRLANWLEAVSEKLKPIWVDPFKPLDHQGLFS